MDNPPGQKATDLLKYLSCQHGIAEPGRVRGLKLVSGKDSGIENAHHVVAVMTSPVDVFGSKEFKMLDSTLLDPQLHKIADIAFNIAAIATKENTTPPASVAVHNYVIGILTDHVPGEPLNIVSSDSFEAMVFLRPDRTSISGREMLRKAVQGLRPERSMSF